MSASAPDNDLPNGTDLTEGTKVERNRLQVPRPIPTSEYFPQISGAGLFAVVVLCLVFLGTSFNRLNHTDLWGHLCFGRWIFNNEQLPDHDPFSASASALSENAIEFVNVPWLAQVIGYMTYQVLGLDGLVLGHAALATLSAVALIGAIRSRGINLVPAVCGAGLAYVISLPITGTIRPQLFGAAAFPLVLMACGEISRQRHPIWWLPFLIAVWANLHGSFILGLGILGLSAGGETWDAWRQPDGASHFPILFRRWLLLILCLGFSCINPLGPKLLVSVATFGGNFALPDISEWRQLTIKSLGGSLFFMSGVATCFVFRRSRTRFQAHEILLLLIFGLFALLSMRMLIWWGIVWAWVMVRHVVSIWQSDEKTADDFSYPQASQATMRTLFAMVTIFIVAINSPATQPLILSAPRSLASITSSDTPLYVADEMLRRHAIGRVYCPLDWGDYLIWKSGEAIQPLVFSHVHLVSHRTWNDYRRIGSGDRNWLSLADDHRLEYLVLSRERNGSLRRQIERHPRAEVLYQDQQSLLVRILPEPSDPAGGSS